MTTARTSHTTPGGGEGIREAEPAAAATAAAATAAAASPGAAATAGTPGGATATAWPRVAALAGALVLLVTVMVTAFVWPAVAGAPREIPLGLVATADQAAALGAAVEHAEPGAFAVTVYGDAAAARNAIEEREVYGALVIGPDGVAMLTAPAAGPAVATALGEVARAIGASLAGQQGAPVVETVGVEPVVDLPADDPRGAGFASAALPLVLTSVATGVVAALTVRGLGRKVALVATVAAGAGLAVQVVAGAWLGVLTGSAWAQVGVVALAVGAVGLAVVGAHAVAGRPGLSLVAATMVLLGNPLSAAASAPELLPAGWAELGQSLPPGALVQALRSVAFFDGAAARAPLTVLAVWLLAGATLVLGRALAGEKAAQRPTPVR